ncbi:hypothetical protein ACJ72_08215, partial [Emergomyces africanus]
MKQPRGHQCSNCHLQSASTSTAKMHPPEWDPWTVKKTLQLSTASMSRGFRKLL